MKIAIITLVILLYIAAQIMIFSFIFKLEEQLADVDDRVTYLEARNLQYASE